MTAPPVAPSAAPPGRGPDFDPADRPSRGRAWRHLLMTTVPVALYTAAYAGTLYWFATFLLGEVASAAVAHRWSEATLRWQVLGAWWFLGCFLPVWVVFSCYGFWLRPGGYDAPLPRALEWLLAACVVALPWFWPVRFVHHPRMVLRNYRRRFRGETLDFMEEKGRPDGRGGDGGASRNGA